MRDIAHISTFPEAEAALQTFDAKYWPHPAGIVSVRHTLNHLMKSVGDVLGSCAQKRSSLLFELFVEPQKDEPLEQVAELLMEHGFRVLSHSLDRSLHDYLCRAQRTEGLTIHAIADSCSDMHSYMHCCLWDGPLSLVITNLVLVLAPLYKEIERWEHEALTHPGRVVPWKEEVGVVIGLKLIWWGIALGPLGCQQVSTAAEEDITSFVLTPFVARMHKLYEKMERETP